MILDDLMRSSDPVIQNAASLTVSAMANFKTGQLSASEYSEIVENILDLKTVIKLTDDMNRQNEIEHAFELLKDIAGPLSSLSGL